MSASLLERSIETFGAAATAKRLHEVGLVDYMENVPDGFEHLTAFEAIDFLWELLARPEQLLPEGDWDTFLIRAGRGWGKTRCGAEGTIQIAEEAARLVEAGTLAVEEAKIHLVGATAADVRDVMVRGPAGILRCSPPWFPARYEPSLRRIVWPGGIEALLFSGEEPDRLRGPQCIAAWCDELAAWKYPDDAWDNLQFGLRLGPNPRAIVTSTPRPISIIKEMIRNPRTIVRGGETRDNARNLSAKAIAKLYAKYGGTRLGRQELKGEVLDDNPNALWRQADIDTKRLQLPSGWKSQEDSGWTEDDKPDFDRLMRSLLARSRATLSILNHLGIQLQRVMIGCDPNVSNNADSDEFGMVVCGIGTCRCKGEPELHGFVLEDTSGLYTPGQWGALLVRLYNVWEANMVIAEINNGGVLVEQNLRGTDGGAAIPYLGVHAKKGKLVRAEPVSGLAEQGKIHHVGCFGKLESELTTWDPQDPTAKSPNRLDAMVYAITHLMLGTKRTDFRGTGGVAMPGRRM